MITFDNYVEPRYKIKEGHGSIIGRTEIMIDLFHYLNHLAKLPTSVLLRGESGTGKELFAKALHFNGDSKRKAKPFVAVNCAGIPSELLESELFGYTKGAFTGAYKDTQGKFQYAHGGTILLDEVGDMSPKLQAKVLRVLQERQVTRVGSNNPENVDVRVVAATNRNLEDEVEKGNFREDLYYRLNVVPIVVPSLGERRDDIPLIAQYFVFKYNQLYGVHLAGLSGGAQEKLKWATWRGNVRELENIIERVFVLKEEGVVEAEDLFFNSDMPRKLGVSTPKLEVEGPTSDWYSSGVLPLSPQSIADMEGSKSYSTILKIIGRDGVNSGTFEFGTRNGYLIYLTLQNSHLFFKDLTTKDYRGLEDKIVNNEFNSLITQPFALWSVSELAANPDFSASAYFVKKVADQNRVYQVPVGLTSCIGITLDNLGFFVRGKLDRDQRILRLQKAINDSYERFRSLGKS